MVNKILAMSVWGDNPRYIIGANRQVELAKEFYPDFKIRIYTDNLNRFRNILSDKDIQFEQRTGDNGVFWRFEPLFESEDNIVIVRDSDGRITKRESMAVDQWIQHTDNKFHTFRDHQSHFEFPVIACAFGLKGKLSDDLKKKMDEFKSKPFYYTNDQVYLRDHVWPIVEQDTLVHDMSYGWFAASRSNLMNRYSFCGNGYDEHDMPLYPPTMLECAEFKPTDVHEKYKFDKGRLRDEKLFLDYTYTQ